MRTYNAKKLSLKRHNDTICTSAKFHYLRLKNILRFRRWYSDHAWHVKMELEYSIYKDWNLFITFDISYKCPTYWKIAQVAFNEGVYKVIYLSDIRKRDKYQPHTDQRRIELEMHGFCLASVLRKTSRYLFWKYR